LNLMDENTALAMFTAYADDDTWNGGNHDVTSEKGVCGSLLPKLYYQQQIESTVNQWIEDERRNLKFGSRSSSITDSPNPNFRRYARPVDFSPLPPSERTISSTSSAPHSSRSLGVNNHLDVSSSSSSSSSTFSTMNRLRRASLNAVYSPYQPIQNTTDAFNSAELSRACSVPAMKTPTQNSQR
jgi:hypothetical protein